MRATINAIWIGGRIGPEHAACLASFVRAGHRVLLHSFDRIEDMPVDVTHFDATQLMASNEIIRYNNGQPGTGFQLTANIYRLRMMRENMGIYVDCDLYCLKPFPDDAYLFGWESHEMINNAVLRLPHDSALLAAMTRDAENPHFIPPWLKPRVQRRWRIRQLLGAGDTRPGLDWGSLGPILLTHHVKRLALEHLAKAEDIFYPVSHTHKQLLNQPELTMEDLTTHRSAGLHLWSSKPMTADIRPGSVMAQILGDTDHHAGQRYESGSKH